jgi:hypothetical protein
VSILSSSPTTDNAEVAAFAASIAALLQKHPTSDTWAPTSPADDRSDEVTRQLRNVGWFDLGNDPQTTSFVTAAARELGLALAPVSLIDSVLPAPLAVNGDKNDESWALSRYADDSDAVLYCSRRGVALIAARACQPVAYVDSWAVQHFSAGPQAGGLLDSADARDAWRTWIAAMTGYLAGLAAGGYECALAHVQNRIAFGKPLIRIESVANKMADARMTADGLQHLVAEPPSVDALRHASVATRQALALCHQVVGAIGFTLEFPLQRYSRRANALDSWNAVTVDALTATSAADGQSA